MRLYRQACEICHRAPGTVRSPVALALEPEPADLSSAATRWQPSELFWIIKYGIRMSGMPAWRDVYTDEHIWDIVAALRHLPQISPAEYDELRNPPTSARPAADDGA